MHAAQTHRFKAWNSWQSLFVVAGAVALFSAFFLLADEPKTKAISLLGFSLAASIGWAAFQLGRVHITIDPEAISIRDRKGETRYPFLQATGFSFTHRLSGLPRRAHNVSFSLSGQGWGLYFGTGMGILVSKKTCDAIAALVIPLASPHVLRHALATFKAGQSVAFGSLTATREGLSYKGLVPEFTKKGLVNPTDALSWPAFKGIARSQDGFQLEIHQMQGPQPWKRIPTVHIHNLGILEPFLAEVTAQLRNTRGLHPVEQEWEQEGHCYLRVRVRADQVQNEAELQLRSADGGTYALKLPRTLQNDTLLRMRSAYKNGAGDVLVQVQID